MSSNRHPLIRLDTLVIVTLLAILFAPTANAMASARFARCIDDIRNGTRGVGNSSATDGEGNIITDLRNATGLTYEACVSACGGGPGPFRWNLFSEQLTTWLIPWFALLSQLPFGPRDRLDNLESVLLTVGSPTLAAYSLALTILNGRWIARRFSKCTYPNTRNAIRVLSSLQQSPLRISDEHALLSSLIVLPHNDRWWKELIEWLEHPHTWSVGAVASMIWVVIALLFTGIDWFVEKNSKTPATGFAVNALWSWLLPIVLGWLVVSPKCNEEQIRSAIDRANQSAFVATETHIVPAYHLPEECRAFTLDLDGDDELQKDQRNTSPLYNFSRFMSWVQCVEMVLEQFQAASTRCQRHESVNPNSDWVLVQTDEKPDVRNRVGDIFQVARYCSLEGLPVSRGVNGPRSRWGPDLLSRIATASFLALLLQWGTTGAAIIIAYHTPTIGLGCVSGSYLIFGLLATLVWMMQIASSLLAHHASPPLGRCQAYPNVRNCSTAAARWSSIALRRTAKLLAICNAIGITTSCLLQFSRLYDNCYCATSAMGLGKGAYLSVAYPASVISRRNAAWIAGPCLATAAVIAFISFIFLFIGTPLPKGLIPSQNEDICLRRSSRHWLEPRPRPHPFGSNCDRDSGSASAIVKNTSM